MATSSILHNIEIKDKESGNQFATALEVAYNNSLYTENIPASKAECIELTDNETVEFISSLL